MRQEWDEKSIELLRQNYPRFGAAECMKLLGRTKSSINHKAERLKLSAPGSKKRTNEQYDLELFEKEINWLRLGDYVNNRTPLLHECINGHQILINPSSVLDRRECTKCLGIHKKNNSDYDLELDKQFIRIENYLGAHIPILHKCLCKNHKFLITPHDILKRKSCPKCTLKGFKRYKPAILYYIKLTNGYYKIGITNRTIEERFSNFDKISKIAKILSITQFTLGRDAEQTEQSILREYEEFRWRPLEPYLTYKGDTEIFIKDVLNLDK